MTTAPEPPSTDAGADTGAGAEAPAHTPPGYACSDCVTPTPAVEVHVLSGPLVVAYCAQCAPSWRPFAHMVTDVTMAHTLGLRVTAQ